VTYALGIDLGTTFTAGAVARADGTARIVDLGNHSAAIPSLVFLREDDTVLVGDAAARRGVAEPQRLAREFKRRVGDEVPIMLGRTPYSAERLMGHLLGHVVAAIADREGGPASAVAVSHPANWGPFKVDLLRQAVANAGLPNARFVTEPVAAAIQYASTERVEAGRIVGVYDLGGGTFDAALLRKTAVGFETLGDPQGIERLGGIDFDEAVFRHVLDAIGGIDELDLDDTAVRTALAHLRAECVSAKEALSADADASVAVLLPGVNTQVRITRDEFEDMVRPALRETVDTMRRAIAAAGTAPEAIDVVLLAGGSSRIPLIAELLRAELGRPVAVDSHPKLAVALGAARLAAGAAFDVPVAAAAPAAASEAPAEVHSPAAPPPATAAPPTPAAARPPADPVPEQVPAVDRPMPTAVPLVGTPPAPVVAPAVAEPAPDSLPTVPVAAAAAAGSAPPAPPRPRIREARPAGSAPAPRGRGRLLAIAGIAAVVIAGGSAAFALGGGPGDAEGAPGSSVVADSTSTTTTTLLGATTVPETTTASPPPPPPPPATVPVTTPRATTPTRTCQSPSGRCASITTIDHTDVQLTVYFKVSGVHEIPLVRMTLTDRHGARTTWDGEAGVDHIHLATEPGVEWVKACLAVVDDHRNDEPRSGNCRDLPSPTKSVAPTTTTTTAATTTTVAGATGSVPDS